MLLIIRLPTPESFKYLLLTTINEIKIFMIKMLISENKLIWKGGRGGGG